MMWGRGEKHKYVRLQEKCRREFALINPPIFEKFLIEDFFLWFYFIWILPQLQPK